MTETALVTGGTGLLGYNLVRLLLQRGFAVRVVARNTKKAGRVLGKHGRLTVLPGDMGTVEDWAAEALQGVERLFHLAAFYRDSWDGKDHWAEMKAINVDASALLMRAARDAGVGQACHVSSVATLMGRDGQPAGPDDLRSEAEAEDDYFRSKVLSDAALREVLAEEPDWQLCFVCPGFMWGPGDLGPTPAGRMLLDWARGKMPARLPTGFSVVDARDVAAAMIRATDPGVSTPGKRWLMAGRWMSFDQVGEHLAAVTGKPAPSFKMSWWMLHLAGLFGSLYARLTGKRPPATRESVRLLKAEGDARFAPELCEQALGITPTPFRQTAQDSFDFYVERGKLKPPA